YYNQDGKPHSLKKIRTEEVQYTELFPLIPYIFFKENSDSPGDKTQTLVKDKQAGKFTVKSLSPDAMKINTRTLDIIGSRMNDYPETNLTIIGTNDGKGELKSKDLSQKRAEFAKNYLVSTYNVPSEKIQTQVRNLPEKPSTSLVPDGIEENRRLELSSDDSRMLAPIIIQKEKQNISDPNLIEFVPYTLSSDSITSWDMSIYQSDRKLRGYEGIGKPEQVRWAITPDELTSGDLPVDYSLKVTNSAGMSKNASGSIPVEFFSFSRKKVEEMADKTISKFSLVLFDFDKADISAKDMQIIEKDIIPAIKFNSTVHIYGYTDRIGEPEYNKKLAERRAAAVRDLLQKTAASAKFDIHAVGESEIIFDNNSPIGRQLSRTVQIVVITPK
ncbi:MAG: OmpA-like protein, partial [Bacteroidota bacterium]|nr:OmpA-like protein [Bacteroidota bacterium]